MYCSEYMLLLRNVAISISDRAVKQHKTTHASEFKQSDWTEATRPNESEAPYQLAQTSALHDWEHCAPAFNRCRDQISPRAHTQCRMQDRLYRSDLAGCVTMASNAWPVMAMTPRTPPLASQFVISDPATVTGDRLMIVPSGCLGQIGWAAARFCCNWATSQHWWWWGQNVSCMSQDFLAPDLCFLYLEITRLI